MRAKMGGDAWRLEGHTRNGYRWVGPRAIAAARSRALLVADDVASRTVLCRALGPLGPVDVASVTSARSLVKAIPLHTIFVTRPERLGPMRAAVAPHVLMLMVTA